MYVKVCVEFKSQFHEDQQYIAPICTEMSL